jgi:aspartate/methionine/tyrosine aminotransferase
LHHDGSNGNRGAARAVLQPAGEDRTMEEFYQTAACRPMFRTGQPPEGQGARRAVRISSISAWAIPICRRQSHINEKLIETVRQPAHPSLFLVEGHQWVAPRPGGYYARRFGVKLNPETQVVATLGSKEGFANMAQAITAPGDVDSGAQSELSDPRLRVSDGGRCVRSYSLSSRTGFFHALERAVQHSIPKPLALMLCYPSNPTALVADLDFYRDVVAFAVKHDIIVLSDLAYSEIYFDDNPPPSILQVPRRDGCRG